MRIFNLIPTAAAALIIASGVFSQATSSSNTAVSSSATSKGSTPATTTSANDEGKDATPSSTTTSSASSTSSIDIVEPEMACRQHQVVSAPFCRPLPYDVWRTDGNYYVTWDSDMWSDNSTVYIKLNYADASGGGKIVHSYEFPNVLGAFDVQPKEEWLYNQTLRDQGIKQKLVNQTLYFVIWSDDVTTPGARGPHSGPVFLLTSEPIEGDIVNEPSKTPMPSKLGLFIGLPVMFGFVVAMVCGTHFCMRRQRQIGPIVIGGGGKRFKKGYTGREARRSRARQAGGVATYRDEDEDAAEVGMAAPVPKPKSEWELTSVKGGRDSLQ